MAIERLKYDLTGQKFGYALAIEHIGHGRWKCKCDCGNTFVASGQMLRTHRTKSCGCWQKNGDYRTGRTIKHGKTHTRIHRIWMAMLARCSSPGNTAYKNYGGRGITVCDEWKNSFMSFYEWAIDNGYNDTLTIDRVDNEKEYSPENCRWATRKTQLNNTRRNHFITYDGKTLTVAQWSELLGISIHALSHRIERGWSIERAFTTPVHAY